MRKTASVSISIYVVFFGISFFGQPDDGSSIDSLWPWPYIYFENLFRMNFGGEYRIPLPFEAGAKVNVLAEEMRRLRTSFFRIGLSYRF